MKRYLTAFLLTYSIAMTLLAGWLGARAFVYWKIATLWAGSGGIDPTHEQVLANFGAPRLLTGPANETAMLVAALDPANIAAAALLIVLSCLGFAARRQARPTNPDLQKD